MAWCVASIWEEEHIQGCHWREGHGAKLTHQRREFHNYGDRGLPVPVHVRHWSTYMYTCILSRCRVSFWYPRRGSKNIKGPRLKTGNRIFLCFRFLTCFFSGSVSLYFFSQLVNATPVQLALAINLSSAVLSWGGGLFNTLPAFVIRQFKHQTLAQERNVTQMVNVWAKR